MPRRITRVDVDQNKFLVDVDGSPMFECEREFFKNGRRGVWLLTTATSIGRLIMDRDQYSNDILEGVKIHLNERPVYGSRFKKDCTRDEFNKNAVNWPLSLAEEFGGTWSAEYDVYTGRAIFEKV